MTAGRRDFDSALGLFLADDLREVHIGRDGVRPLRSVPQAGIFRRIPNQQVLAILRAGQDPYRFIQGADPIDPDLPELHGFHCRLYREDAAPESHPSGHFGIGQGPGDLPDFPIQAQFPHQEILSQGRKAALLRSGDDTQGDRQVISAPVLPQVRRSQVDDDFLTGDMVSERLEGVDGPEQAFLHGHISQANQVDADPAPDIDLHGHGDGFDTDTFGAIDLD